MPMSAAVSITVPESLAVATRWMRRTKPKNLIPVHWDDVTIGLDYMVVGHVDSIVTDGRHTDINITLYSGTTNCHTLINALNNHTTANPDIGIRTTTTRAAAKVKWNDYPTISYVKETLTALTIITRNIDRARWRGSQLRIAVRRIPQTATI